MAQNFFQQRKHKRFNYKPRFGTSDSETSKQGFGDKWQEARNNNSKGMGRGIGLKWLLVLLVLLLIAMYYLETRIV